MASADEERVRRIEDLVRRMEQLPEGEGRTVAQSLMEAVLELHGAGLERMMDIVWDSGEFGKAAVRKFANDGLVSSLLVLHDLHPDDLETRVQKILSKLESGKASGKAELIGSFENNIRVRVIGGCGWKDLVESSIREAAPDAVSITVEEAPTPGGFVSLESLGFPFSRPV